MTLHEAVSTAYEKHVNTPTVGESIRVSDDDFMDAIEALLGAFGGNNTGREVQHEVDELAHMKVTTLRIWERKP